MSIEAPQTKEKESETEASFLYSVGEECLHAITHGVAALLSFIGALVLIVYASLYGETVHVASMIVFGTSSFLLYLFSTLYHSLSRTRANAVFQRFDHIAIYLMIAGTYTPISLCIIQGALGWILFSLIWTLAIFGIIFKAVFGVRYDVVSTILYVVMGWMILLVIQELLRNLPVVGVALLFAGGLAYTGGVYFYLQGERRKWHHGIWHGCVMVGTVFHFLAMLLYVIP
jgi:hemolysin III